MLPELCAQLSEKSLTGLAWSCHRALAPDLAFTLFVESFDRNFRSPKFLAALESDARKAGRIPELLEVYEARAPEHRPLYGRMRKLRKWFQTG